MAVELIEKLEVSQPNREHLLNRDLGWAWRFIYVATASESGTFKFHADPFTERFRLFYLILSDRQLLSIGVHQPYTGTPTSK